MLQEEMQCKIMKQTNRITIEQNTAMLYVVSNLPRSCTAVCMPFMMLRYISLCY